MIGQKDDRVFVAHILDEASFVMETMVFDDVGDVCGQPACTGKYEAFCYGDW